MAKFEQYINRLTMEQQQCSLADLSVDIEDYISGQKATEFRLTVEPIKSKRSDMQNRLFHALCRDFVILAQETAIFEKDLSHWTMPAFKGLFKKLYLEKTDPKSGFTITQGTSQLNVEQFTKFLDQVIKDFLAHGGVIMGKDKAIFDEAMGKK
jgi:hypothetical protein